MKTEAQNWREILGDLVGNPQERDRVAKELSVNSVTLTRWVAGASTPRTQNLRHLLRLFPEHREILARSMREEFSDFLDLGSGDIPSSGTEGVPTSGTESIPASFYTNVLEMYKMVPSPLRFWSIAKFILYQALGHLDPSRLGMYITVAKCVSPSPGHKVRSLRETIGLGTSPWSDTLEAKSLFYGVETHAGYAIASGHSFAVNDLANDKTYFSLQHAEYAASLAACSILRVGRVAGCVVASSTQRGYFEPSKLALIESYTDLISLAFADHDFYSLEDVKLAAMPPYQIQARYFSNFRQRTTAVMMQAARSNQPINLDEAEQTVLHQLEEELLSSHVEENPASI